MHPAADLAAAPGAYVLVIALAAPTSVRLAGRAAQVLRPGHYAYCGSAYGPGGIRARVARHVRRDKASRWHVDQLTDFGDVLAVAGMPGAAECELFSRLVAIRGAFVPIRGFGSSDCRRCPAHLAGLSGPIEIAALIPGATVIRLDDPRSRSPAPAGPDPGAAA